LLDVNMPEMDGFMFVQRLHEMSAPVGTTILMLSSAGKRGDAARCRQLGVQAYLTKPVKRSELLEAILASLSAEGLPARSDQLITRHTLRQGRSPLTILLAEDNSVNQRLASRVLEKMGHAVTTVETGLAAVEAWREAVRMKEAFDVILMDVQMPEMDGLQATGLIRQQEGRVDRRTPIVAMTAHALRGDKERCLAAGMDWYLSKPLSTKDLQEVLVNISLGRIAEARTAEEPVPSGDATWDQAVALARVDGDPEILRDVVGTLLADLPREREVVDAAVRAGDSARLADAAHSLKGALAAVSARGSHTAAEALERVARAGNLDGCSGGLATLQHEVARLMTDLQRFLTNPPGVA